MKVAEIRRAAPLRTIQPYTCGGCESKWTGLSYAHCSGCHRTFSAVGLFDRHRRLGGCLDPAIMRTKANEPIMRLDGGIWRDYRRDERSHA